MLFDLALNAIEPLKNSRKLSRFEMFVRDLAEKLLMKP